MLHPRQAANYNNTQYVFCPNVIKTLAMFYPWILKRKKKHFNHTIFLLRSYSYFFYYYNPCPPRPVWAVEAQDIIRVCIGTIAPW